ncbi:DUF262 domain-containing HNH endonuclease family protein [uncultured Psychrobacter sp.]|uniref:DUF262 domain-containing protein n=1 Tax=uncultured Psychrobacter sp. TaxID=259303 RepID=UPI002617AF1D|nr:DUF262 domain-containing HNH endonuclease family protein [uncultured Psychrobacter sp.]
MTNPNLSTTKDVISLTPRQMLDGTAHYLIPMYQRNFAWGNDEIEQLITDIIDAQINSRTSIGHKNYYLGTLVVFERPEPSSKHKVFEVIDGQQRFTTLSLLIIYLKNYFASNDNDYDMSWYEAQNIEFESRPKSTQTLNLLLNDNLENYQHFDQDGLNPAIINGYKSIEKVMKDKFDSANPSENQHHKISIQDFCHYLFTYVQISRVPVPDETDLNHYFEVMNNRGEQLEKHEIIKARLLSVVEKADSSEIDVADKQPLKALIHDVWEACANMNKYVQYGFSTTLRTELFSNNLSVLKPKDFNALLDIYKNDDEQNNTQASKSQPPSLYDILADGFTSPPNPNDTADKGDDDGISETYYSLVNFSVFLLHTLRIMINIQSSNQKDIALDDKQLLTQFETYILARSVSKMSQNVETKDKITPLSQVKTFIYTLLKSKFIFDHFIIKRNMQDNKGQWTLNKLTKGEDKKNSYYKNSFENDNNDLVMLQSAFHVSTPTTNYKHWLNAVLYYSYQHYQHNDIGLDSTAYLSHIETIARAFMLRRYLTDEPDDYHHIIYQTPDFTQISFTNTDASLTPHHLRAQIKQYLRYDNIRNIFVFNYLDYLLWKDEKYSEFTFTARSSIEHFYPQNKRDDKLFINDKNKEDTLLHSFGNLCLISHSLNSRVSNDMPDVKVKYFSDGRDIKTGNIDSLKLLKMIQHIDDKKEIWDKTMIENHEDEMLEVLMQGLNLTSKDTES